MGERDEPVGEPGRAHVAGGGERSGRRGRRAPERADRELRRPRRAVRARTPGTAGRRPTRTCSAPGCPARRSSARPPTSARSTTSSPASRRRRRRGARATTTRRSRTGARPSAVPTRRATPTARSPTTSSRGSRSSREDPVVFLIGQYYGGLCNGVEDCSADDRAAGPRRSDGAGRRGRPRRLRHRRRRPVEPTARRRRAARRPPPRPRRRSSRRTPAPLDNLPQNLLVVALLALLADRARAGSRPTGSASARRSTASR